MRVTRAHEARECGDRVDLFSNEPEGDRRQQPDANGRRVASFHTRHRGFLTDSGCHRCIQLSKWSATSGARREIGWNAEHSCRIRRFRPPAATAPGAESTSRKQTFVFRCMPRDPSGGTDHHVRLGELASGLRQLQSMLVLACRRSTSRETILSVSKDRDGERD
jgi:hypothetical protein